jgi:hypothetical protein
MKAYIDVTLTSPFKYHHQGAEAEAKTLTLKAPFSNLRGITTKLKQAFFQALKFHESGRKLDQETPQSGAAEDLDGKQILALMFMSNVDMEEFMANFKALMVSQGVCLIDGVEQMTSVTYDRMSDEDADTVVGDYLANFIVSSLMKNLATAPTG